MVNPFVYFPRIINVLERALSADRLSTYLTVTGQDHAAALRLYVWNTRISAALYGPLQALEIAIRNGFHRELAALYGPAWYDNTRVPLTPAARARVEEAKDAVRRTGRPLDPPRVIAELSFGFWERLLTRGPPGKINYEMGLWRPALYRAFPNSRRRRAEVHRPLPGLRDLRNRIAHHEPIFARDLIAEYQLILEVIGWMCADTRDWTAHHSEVPAVSDRQWRCTDIGTRTIAAIRIDSVEVGSDKPELRRTLDRVEAEAEGWFNGPPYAVAESVFDEDDQKGCTIGPEDACPNPELPAWDLGGTGAYRRRDIYSDRPPGVRRRPPGER